MDQGLGGVTRGDLVVIAFKGEYGSKPRPALVIQADEFSGTASVTVLLLTSELRNQDFLRIDIAPTTANGLREASQIMIDKCVTVPRHGRYVDATIGRVDETCLRAVSHALVRFFGLGI